ALQVHHPAPARPDETTWSQLALLGDPAELWDLLTDNDVAVLGACSLVRPGKVNLVWNPSDHRCSTILLSARPGSAPRLRAIVCALPQSRAFRVVEGGDSRQPGDACG